MTLSIRRNLTSGNDQIVILHRVKRRGPSTGAAGTELSDTGYSRKSHVASSASRNVVLVALAANLGIALAKFAAAAWTRSSAMLSEAIHSLIDTANQALLLHGLNRAERPADARHPFGYSRELYFWSFVVAILLFSMGAGFSIYEGVEKLRDPHPVSDFWVNYIVLGVALTLESYSAYSAFTAFDAKRGQRGWIAALRASKDAALFAVLLEDLAAVAGLLIALGALLCVQFLGWQQADAIGSILIGLLLAAVATFMSIEIKGLLVGEAASADVRAGIEEHHQAGGRSRSDRSSRSTRSAPCIWGRRTCWSRRASMPSTASRPRGSRR